MSEKYKTKSSNTVKSILSSFLAYFYFNGACVSGITLLSGIQKNEERYKEKTADVNRSSGNENQVILFRYLELN